MLQLQQFRQNKDLIIKGLEKKNFKNIEIVSEIIVLDQEKRNIQQQAESVAAAINNASKQIGQLMTAGNKAAAEEQKNEVSQLKEKSKELHTQLENIEKELTDKILQVPNLPHESVPRGNSPEENETVKTFGDIPQLSESAVPHWELTSKYNLIDFELGNKLTGSGFPVYINQGARLQRALIQMFLDYNIKAGYTEYMPPLMVNEATAYGTGQLPDKEGQMYLITADGFYMLPTAEVPVTNIYRDEIVKEALLPIKMTAYTPCFRREAGSYGKDVRGLNRLHQFDKVEIVQLTKPEDSYTALEGMVQHVEGLLQLLELPYRILRLCGGDMSFTAALTYDFETYSTAQQRWLEVSSVSNFETFQTNRMKIRYKDESGKTILLHSLNGSSLALPRIVACILENNQTPEGIKLPKALWPYFGAEMIK